jgi:DNA helicase-2/ATP-dependent DNA helicase PcrA
MRGAYGAALFLSGTHPCYDVPHMTDTIPYLEGLNGPQRNAVLHTEGPLLILAGAGSGKTRVITHRVVHLIHQGVAPHNILAVTFTNKSAREMRDRVERLVHQFPPSDRAALDSLPTVTTFHSLGVRILREFHEVLGLRRHFTIYDRADSVRAVKRALEQAQYNPKEFEPKRILGIISRAKGDAVSVSEFKDAANSYPEQVASTVWEKYEAILREEHALDFDDLLARTLRLLRDHPPVRQQLQERFRYIHIDEYQDTNRVQFAIVEQLVGETQNLCVVGDIDQCLTGDTLITMADGTKRPLQKIIVGDQVRSNYGTGDYRPATVRSVKKHQPHEPLVTITTSTGRTLTSTAHHKHFAGYQLGRSPQLHYVYLMRKDGVGYRLGISSVYTKGQVKPMLGFVQRLNQEHGDAVWVLDTFETATEARVAEYCLSLQYQIPTLPFVARRGMATGGYVQNQAMLKKIFAQFDTMRSGEQILRAYHLSPEHPHHRPQVSRSSRQNIIVTLCGDHRGQTPMHRVSVAGSDPATKKILLHHGFSVRPVRRANQNSWRFETCHKSYREITALVRTLQTILPHAVVIEYGRLGAQSAVRDKNSLPVTTAASVRPGMVVFAADGSYDVIASVTHDTRSKTVYDLTIEPTHNFIANDIVTHNSIYSWRGADIKNVMQFERHFPRATTILLEENYRSTKTIIAASNDVIKKNKHRVEKNVFTNNTEGEPITLYAAMSGQDEAEYIATTAQALIKSGIAPSSIAVLYRTNFQSRALEEAFLAAAVPYQLLGTKFFERKEVKDVLSYLRLALNPGSSADLARIINEPARGIGKVTILRIIEGKRAELNTSATAKVKVFDDIMMDIATYARTNPLSETIKFIMQRSGLERALKDEGTEEALERLENIRELVTLASRYSELPPEEAVEQFLESAALQSDQDELKDKSEHDAVRLMTVHAAKGLEFGYVFITGLEEGLFPHERLDDGKIDTEEERRLFYVALTRAEQKLYLTYAHLRTIFGSQRVNLPSSFLNDISPDLVESANPHGNWGGGQSGYETTVYLD